MTRSRSLMFSCLPSQALLNLTHRIRAQRAVENLHHAIDDDSRRDNRSKAKPQPRRQGLAPEHEEASSTAPQLADADRVTAGELEPHRARRRAHFAPRAPRLLAS